MNETLIVTKSFWEILPEQTIQPMAHGMIKIIESIISHPILLCSMLILLFVIVVMCFSTRKEKQIKEFNYE